MNPHKNRNIGADFGAETTGLGFALIRLQALLGGLVFVLLILPWPLGARELDEFATSIFDRTHDRIKKVLSLHDEHDDLPDSSWVPFARDKNRNADKITALIDEVIDVLETSKINELRGLYIEKEEQIALLQEEIDHLRQGKITAPMAEDSSGWTPWVKTREKYQKSIEEKIGKIESASRNKDAIVEKLHTEFNRIGIELSGEQVRFFLSTISEENIFCLCAVFHNVKQISLQFAELARVSGEDVEAAKRYYGMYTMMVKVLLRAHDIFIDEIESHYVPEVRKILKENAVLAEDTKLLMRKEKDQECLDILRLNLEAQGLTDRAGRLYVQHLGEQKRRLQQNRATLYKTYRVARNTYDTAKVAANLVALLNTNIRDLNALQKLQLPDMIPFENRELQSKFEEITLIMERGE